MEAEPTPDMLEICFNLWLVVDRESGLVYNYMGKAYGLRGTTEQKLTILRYLSAEDHCTVQRRMIPKRFKYVSGGRELTGMASLSLVRNPNSFFWNELFVALERELPPVVRFVDGKTITQPMTISPEPLFVETVLLEDEFGVLIPQLKRT